MCIMDYGLRRVRQKQREEGLTGTRGSVCLVWDLEDPGGHSRYLLGGLSLEVEGLHSVSTPACLSVGAEWEWGRGAAET